MSLFVSYNDIVADIAERISFAEHGKLVAESSEFHLTLSRAHKAHFFSNSKYAKKRDILSEKRDCAKQSVSLRPKAVLCTWLCFQRPCALVVSGNMCVTMQITWLRPLYAQMPGCPLCPILTSKYDGWRR